LAPSGWSGRGGRERGEGSNLGFSQVSKKLPSAKINGSWSRAYRGARGVENSVKGGQKQPPLSRILALFCLFERAKLEALSEERVSE
jgi:hypothetical protein